MSGSPDTGARSSSSLTMAKHSSGIDHEVASSAGPLDDLSTADEWSFESQNCTLFSMLRVYCSRCMDDWDKHMPQVMGAYKTLNTQQRESAHT